MPDNYEEYVHSITQRLTATNAPCTCSKTHQSSLSSTMNQSKSTRRDSEIDQIIKRLSSSCGTDPCPKHGRRPESSGQRKKMTPEEIEEVVNRLTSSESPSAESPTPPPQRSLGHQSLTPYEIDQVVARLCQKRSEIAENGDTRNGGSDQQISQGEIDEIVARLTADKGEKTPDSQRVAKDKVKELGIVNSFLWKGWN